MADNASAEANDIMHSSTRSGRSYRQHDLSISSIGSSLHFDPNLLSGPSGDEETPWSGADPNDTITSVIMEDESDVHAEELDAPSVFDSANTSDEMGSDAIVQAGVDAIEQVKRMLISLGWKSEMKHRSGVHVWSMRVGDDKIPVYRGEKTIEGFTPEQVLAVVRHKQLWDEWYERGNLVENVDDSTSVTYMVMKTSVPSTKPRDLVLVERLEENEDTLILGSTSVTTSLCPPAPGRIRARLQLYGWRLESCIGNTGAPSTKATYLLHTHVGGNAPRVLQKKVLSRRPLVISAVEQYLHRYGVPNFDAGENDHGMLSNRVAMMTTKSQGSLKHSLTRTHRSSSSIASTGELSSTSLPSPDTDNGLLPQPEPERKRSAPIVSFMEPNKPGKTRPREDSDATPVASVGGLGYDLSSYTNNLPDVVPAAEVVAPVAKPKLPAAEPKAPTTITKPMPSATESVPSATEPVPSVAKPTPSASVPKIQLPSEATPVPVTPTTPAAPSTPNLFRQSVMPAAMPTHRHAAAILAGRELGAELLPLEKWTFQSEVRGVRISTIPIPGKSMPAVRGDMTITGWTTEEIVAVIRAFSCRTLWDERFDGGRAVEVLDARSVLFHSNVKGTFPVSGRDFCGVSEVRVDPTTQALHYMAVSVEDPAVPPVSKRVRAQLDLMLWVLKASPSDPTSVEVSYLTQVDPRGSIPSSLVKAVQNQTPLCIAGIADYLKKHAAPPYVTRTTLSSSDEDYDYSKSTWTVALSSKATGADQVRGTEVKVGRTTWGAAGYEIATKPADAEIIRIEDGFRVVLRGAGRVELRVTKNSSGKSGAVKINGKSIEVGRSTSAPPAVPAASPPMAPRSLAPAASSSSLSTASPAGTMRHRQVNSQKATVIVSPTPQRAMPSLAPSSSASSTPSSEKTIVASMDSRTTPIASPATPMSAALAAASSAPFRGVPLTRKARSETMPSLPVRVIRWQRLTDSQVAFIALVTFLAFYSGLLYERLFVGGVLKWLESR